MTGAGAPLKKAYVQTPHGQSFYRMCGDGPALVLLHWTPLSSHMYRHIMPLFADAGYSVWAFDLLGYGRSDPRPEVWSMPDYGHSIIAAMEALDLREAAIVGGHNGASIALEAVLHRPALFQNVILDGCPVLTPELREAFKGMSGLNYPQVTEDGAHRTLIFDRALGLMKEYIPDFDVTNDTLSMIFDAMRDYLETGFVSSAPVAGAYDVTERLPKLATLNIPALIISARTDFLFSGLPDVQECLPDAATHIFDGHHPVHFQDRAQVYAAVILDFLSQSQTTHTRS